MKTEKELSPSVLGVPSVSASDSCVEAGTTLADTALPGDMAPAFVASAFVVDSSK